MTFNLIFDKNSNKCDKLFTNFKKDCGPCFSISTHDRHKTLNFIRFRNIFSLINHTIFGKKSNFSDKL
ncbi:hypothetical protein BpHYR1_049565 [Brachionus plicatilis]|uniref:Uncharacterized protein n=1 Tax=Brachionus plicatilis TaxID=10195 RepID=A0A3M7QLG0_BRAPC|nr:hypothetical protein BpHYR1_049565 [Brachionus plicatilis]